MTSVEAEALSLDFWWASLTDEQRVHAKQLLEQAEADDEPVCP